MRMVIYDKFIQTSAKLKYLVSVKNRLQIFGIIFFVHKFEYAKY